MNEKEGFVKVILNIWMVLSGYSGVVRPDVYVGENCWMDVVGFLRVLKFPFFSMVIIGDLPSLKACFEELNINGTHLRK